MDGTAPHKHKTTALALVIAILPFSLLVSQINSTVNVRCVGLLGAGEAPGSFHVCCTCV